MLAQPIPSINGRNDSAWPLAASSLTTSRSLSSLPSGTIVQAPVDDSCPLPDALHLDTRQQRDQGPGPVGEGMEGSQPPALDMQAVMAVSDEAQDYPGLDSPAFTASPFAKAAQQQLPPSPGSAPAEAQRGCRVKNGLLDPLFMVFVLLASSATVLIALYKAITFRRDPQSSYLIEPYVGAIAAMPRAAVQHLHSLQCCPGRQDCDYICS
jgi:hypothetical protein